jgi:hypothetical protein
MGGSAPLRSTSVEGGPCAEHRPGTYVPTPSEELGDPGVAHDSGALPCARFCDLTKRHFMIPYPSAREVS